VRAIAALVLLALPGVGCHVPAPAGPHAIRFDVVHEPPAAVVTEQKSYFFWGLVPTRHVDVLAKCPYGVTAITDGGPTGFLPTLGLWSRRPTTYYCRAAPRRAS
jgi:hypothetical protein